MTSETIEAEQTGRAPVTLDRHKGDGAVLDTVELDAGVFGLVPNVPLMHQVVTAQLATRRAGTQSTRTRAEVAGGGAKPYRQKGTGRARQGSIRAPHYAGGGVALGPKPRSYAQHTPRKMIRQALHSALSDRLGEGRVRIVDAWPFEVPKTKDAVKLLGALELSGRVLVVVSPEDAVAERSFGNLPEVRLVERAQLTAYEVLAADWIIFTTATVPGGVTVVEGSAAKPARKPRAKKVASSGTGAASGGETAAGDDSSPADASATTAPAVDEADSAEVGVPADTSSESEAPEDSETEASADEDEQDESVGEADDEAEAEVSTPAASTIVSSADDGDDNESDDDEEDEE